MDNSLTSQFPLDGTGQGNRVSLTDVGLTFNTDLTFIEWMELMQTLTRLETAFQFAIGDALVWGEARYGERYSQAMDATGLSYQSLANMAWVSRKVPIENRHADLSWTHHRVVASVDQQDQKGLLAMAHEQGMHATDLQQHISGKPARTRELVQVPHGLTQTEAAGLLEKYASIVIEARSGDAPYGEDSSMAVLSECILCNECPYRSNRIQALPND